jgi:hypothetical protein
MRLREFFNRREKTMVKLGHTVRDAITGFQGVVTARCEYINGCVQFCVTPRVAEDGKMPTGEWIDHQRLEVTGGAEVLTITGTGGPQRNAPSTSYRG